ncbi:MAG: hypothetical protein ACRDIU_00480 [Actinomycetota bacterium]
MFDVISGAKPIDLHPAGESTDPRIYECASCGDRYHDHEVNLMGGLCPKDGAVFRPLGPFERRHPEFRRNFLRRTA